MTDNKTGSTSASSPTIDAVLKRRRASIIEVVDAKSAVDLATAQSYSENVFLFVPNLIGEIHPHAAHTTVPLLTSPRSLPVAWVSTAKLRFPDVKDTLE